MRSLNLKAAPQTVRRLIGAVEYLTHPVSTEKDAYRQRFTTLDQRCESFSSRLNVRRKNISLSAYFFALAQEVSTGSFCWCFLSQFGAYFSFFEMNL